MRPQPATLAAVAVRIVPARRQPRPVERALWRLVRAQRRAVAVVHEWPHGSELRIEIDGALRWSQLFRGDAGELEREAEHKRRALQGRRWADEPLTQLEHCGRPGTETPRLT